MNEDFFVFAPLLASGDGASVTRNHQNRTRTIIWRKIGSVIWRGVNPIQSEGMQRGYRKTAVKKRISYGSHPTRGAHSGVGRPRVSRFSPGNHAPQNKWCHIVVSYKGRYATLLPVPPWRGCMPRCSRPPASRSLIPGLQGVPRRCPAGSGAATGSQSDRADLRTLPGSRSSHRRRHIDRHRDFAAGRIAEQQVQ